MKIFYRYTLLRVMLPWSMATTVPLPTVYSVLFPSFSQRGSLQIRDVAKASSLNAFKDTAHGSPLLGAFYAFRCVFKV